LRNRSGRSDLSGSINPHAGKARTVRSMKSTTAADVAARHAEADDRLRAVIDAAPEDAWDSPSPCEGWSARDVLGHLIDTERSFLSERAGMDPDPEVDTELQTDPPAAWRRHVEAIRPLIVDEDRMAQPFDGHFGPTTVGDTFLQFYVFDMLVHRWDLATALGLPAGFSDDELDLIEASAAGWGDALYMDGVCRSGVEPGPDADRQARVLAMLGRTA
jgi:uncharacterized protein (TIGR03086 family)